MRSKGANAGHFVLQRSWNSLNSFGAELQKLQPDGFVVQRVRIISCVWAISLCGVAFLCAPVRADKLHVSPEVLAAADRIYSGDLEGGHEAALRLQQEHPEHPIGYLLEAEALWWKIWCTSAEFKYGMNFPRHRAKLAADRRYLELAAKASSLAEEEIAQDSAEQSAAAEETAEAADAAAEEVEAQPETEEAAAAAAHADGEAGHAEPDASTEDSDEHGNK